MNLQHLLPITPWHWLGIALIFFVLEMVTVTAYMMWIGIAALATGAALLLLPTLPLAWQSLLFILFSILSTISGLRYLKIQRQQNKKELTLNKKSQQYIGQTFILESPIINNYGSIEIDNTIWRIRGHNLPAGTKVIVTEIEETLLIVRCND